MQNHKMVGGEALRVDAVRAMVRVLDTVGGPEPLAKLLGETAHRVTHWREIPARHVFAVEALTGIPHTEIRPDVDFSAPHFASPWPEGDWVPEGVDVTHLLGSARVGDVDVLFQEFQRAHEVAGNVPCVRNWRAAVLAYDKFALLADQL
jgi:hypothetical protein